MKKIIIGILLMSVLACNAGGNKGHKRSSSAGPEFMALVLSHSKEGRRKNNSLITFDDGSPETERKFSANEDDNQNKTPSEESASKNGAGDKKD